MKIFVSADIEGCAGMGFVRESHRDEACYQEYAKEMTDETVQLCEALHAAGADEIVVKDGHGDASNIDPLAMPDYVTLIRGKSGHPYNMMYGIDESFDGVCYLGYHAPGGDPNFTISHTSTGNSQYILLNGKVMSEFMLNTYTAASQRVPVVFIEGDQRICSLAQEQVPDIQTVVTKKGVGEATYCVSRGKIMADIADKAQKAMELLKTKQKDELLVPFPEEFRYEVHFKDWKRAYKMSFYPGMKQLDTFTDEMVTDSWMDIVTAHCFVVY